MIALLAAMRRARGPRFGLPAVLIIGLLSGAGLSSAALADDEAARVQRENQLQALRSRIHDLTRDIASTRGHRDDVRDQLEDLERSLGQIDLDLRDTETQLKSTRTSMRALENKASTQQQALDGERAALTGSVRAAYAQGHQPMVKLLLNQEDPERVGRMIGYYAYLQRSRIERVKSIRRKLDQLNTLRHDIRIKADRLTELAGYSREQARKFEVQRQARENLLDRLERDLRDKGETIAALERDHAQLERLLQGIVTALEDIPEDLGAAASIKTQRGRLEWPVSGYLQRQYSSSHRGVLIRAERGDEIRAIARGRVAFADWLRGMGLLIIVEHADGFLSLYGHNQSLFKDVGDWVEAGEPLASVGDSGGLSRPALYFELRRKGKPVNPVSWLRKVKGRKLG
ncbi:MAG: murein hydrolase activator EnvC family protein [Gammaproteobacteria bacterium]